MKTLMLSDEQTDYRCDNVQLQTGLAAPQSLHRGFYYQAQTHFQLGAPDVFSGVNMLQQPDYKLWAQNSALYPGSKSWVRQRGQRLSLYINDLTMPSNAKKDHAYYPLARG